MVRDWVERCIGAVYEKQAEGHSEVSGDALGTRGRLLCIVVRAAIQQAQDQEAKT